MANDFELAPPGTVASPPPGMQPSVLTEIWCSEEVSGPTFKSCIVHLNFESFLPDGGSQVARYDLVGVVEAMLDDAGGVWEEIGRMNNPTRAVFDGPHRQIIISPTLLILEEGIDNDIQGTQGLIATRKSKFTESAEGSLRVRLLVDDQAVESTDPNILPFTSVQFSCRLRRFDA